MDHQMALTTQAVERYTLGELTSPEREEFEEHFFSCVDCIAALREYETFTANARAVFKEEADALAPRATPAPAHVPAAVQAVGWRQRMGGWFGIRVAIPAFAALALAFVLFRSPDPAGPAFAWTVMTDVRDETPHLNIGQTTVWLTPSVDLVKGPNQPNRWAAYHWEIRSAGGSIVEQASGHDGAGQLTLKIPAAKFESGKEYKLILQGDASTSPVTGSFVIDRK
jgi:hypothetical protein